MALSKTAKIVIGLVAFIGVVPLALVAAGFFWFRANKDRLLQDGRKAMAEGESFSAAHTQAECITEGLTRNDACGGVLCEAGAGLFLDHCLASREPDPAACADVPRSNQLVSAAFWAQKRCAAVGRKGNQPCGRLMQHVLKHCDSRAADGGK